jgi:hypothetical protein
MAEEDKSSLATVVSLMPKKISEEKPGLFPGTFTLEPAPKGSFSLLHVGVSHYYVYLDSTRGSLRVPELGSQIAKSIVEDYIGAQIAISDERRPGLFWVRGHASPEDINTKFVKELDEARAKQLNWFRALVMLGDDNWKRYGTHTSVSGVQRMAAKELNHKADWTF